MKKPLLLRFLFIGIVLLAFILRIIHIEQAPPGVNRDEASIAYNAYSLLLTGTDEYGRAFPISFQSFGDWKLPVYIYETMLSINAFGLSIFAVRFPSVLAGTISVILAFFIVKKLFADPTLAYLTMALMAISPWSIHLSRTGSESNTAMCMVSAAVLIFLHTITKKTWRLVFSGLLLALTFGTYASNYVFTTLLMAILFFFYKKQMLTKYGITTLLVFVFVSAGIWFQTTSGNVVKISGVSFFSDPAIINERIEIPRNSHSPAQGIISKAYHNKATVGIERFIHNYINAFSPDFLFIKGGINHTHNINYFGNMYLIEAPFFFLGLAFLIMGRKKKSHRLILLWIFIAPLAASLTKDAPHTVRMFAIFPMVPLVTAFGILWLFRPTPRKTVAKRYSMILVLVISSLYLINLVVYLDRYHVHFPKEETHYWGKLYEEINTAISQDKWKEKKIIMANPGNSPYIYFLFYNRYDPKKYQKEVKRYAMTSEGFVHVKAFDRFTFRDIAWTEDLQRENTLLIAEQHDVPPKIRKTYKKYLTDIYLPSGETKWFTIIETPGQKLLPPPLPEEEQTNNN